MTKHNNTTPTAATQDFPCGNRPRSVLRHYGLTVMDVVRGLRGEVNYRTVYRALEPALAGAVDPELARMVRGQVEALLRVQGWQGDSGPLWEGYPAVQGGSRVPPIRRLMRRYGIRVAEIAEATGVIRPRVHDALNPQRAWKVRHGYTVRVRAAVEARLRERGWQGDPASLWAAVDAPFEPEQRAA